MSSCKRAGVGGAQLIQPTEFILTPALLVCCFASTASASIVVEVDEVGGNVVATAFGTFDLTGLDPRFDGSTFSGGLLRGNFGPGSLLVSGSSSTNTTFILTPDVISAPSNFIDSSQPNTFAFLSLGDVVGAFNNLSGDAGIFLPTGYTSGTPLNGTSTWNGETFASLQLLPGSYEWEFTNGETFTLNIGDVAAVPEPGTWALLTLAGIGFGGYRLRRRKKLAK